jgi:PAS domain S-box-containing protein
MKPGPTTISPPAYKAGASAPLGKNGTHHEQDTDKVNILLVDDRPDKLLALEACLGSLQQNIIRAQSGQEALKHLLKEEFAVILLDVSMPGMDGFETATLIRQRPRTEHVPIIFVTSMSDSEKHIFRGYSLGAVDYILSPIVPDVLRTKVSVFVDLYKKAEQIRRQGEQLRQLQQAEYKRELAAVEDRLETETKRNRFFTLALDLLAIADFDGRFLQINPVWEKTLGYSEEELKAKTGLDFIHPDDRDAMAAQLDRLRGGKAVTSFEGRYRCKDGSYRWLGWTATATAPAPGASDDARAEERARAEALIYIFARDITPRKEHEAAIEQLNTQLEHRVQQLTEANAELEAFNYTISHDLRSPLRSMQGFAQALVEDCSAELSDMGKNYTRRIMTSSQYMDTLLQDLLKYSRLSRTEMDRSEIDLHAIVNEIIESLNREVRDKNATIEVRAPLLPACGNLSAVKQVFANLLTNALKFVPPERKPHVTVSTEHVKGLAQTGSAAPAEAVRISIQDNGIGIAAEHQEKIFGLFERLHNCATYPGTGVGLAIVRKAVERMGGRVGLHSKVGEGSHFWFELPSANCATPDDPEPTVATA